MSGKKKTPVEGPSLEVLLRRLVECPPEFYVSCTPASGRLDTAAQQARAIVCDHLRSLQPAFDPTQFLKEFSLHSVNHAGVLAIGAWLLNDKWFTSRAELIESMQKCFHSPRLAKLAQIVKADQFVQDPDRREELARRVLEEMGLRPAGESLEQSADRLTTLDSVERERVIKATLAAEQRAREVREAMARAKAMESSSRYGE